MDTTSSQSQLTFEVIIFSTIIYPTNRWGITWSITSRDDITTGLHPIITQLKSLGKLSTVPQVSLPSNQPSQPHLYHITWSQLQITWATLSLIFNNNENCLFVEVMDSNYLYHIWVVWWHLILLLMLYWPALRVYSDMYCSLRTKLHGPGSGSIRPGQVD